jgi:peptide/nickel transport system substrate-binding protein
VRLVLAFISRFKILIIASIILGILFFFVFKFLLPVISGGSTTRIGITGRYNVSNLPNNILEMIGDGLTKLDENGNVEPNLVTSWETPDKGKTWVFKLKNNLTWQDGKKVTSSTISYAFSDVTIEHPDESTIVFKLQHDYSAFPVIVSKPVFKKGLLGTGEWKVKNLSLSGTYVDHMTLQKNTGEKIIYKFYPDEGRTKLAFEMGETDSIEGLINPTPFSTWPKVKVAKNINTGEYVAVFFNTKDNLLADKEIRQALAYGINKDKLGDMRALGPISIDSWAYNPQVKPYTYDFEKAKSIINNHKKEAKVNEVSINLTIPPILLPEGEKIAKDWEAIGLKINLEVSATVPSEYQALLAILDIPEDPDQYSIWHSTQTATNLTKYHNDRIDKLLEDGRSQLDVSDRKKTYLDFQRFLVEDSPAVFLYYPASYTISRK